MAAPKDKKVRIVSVQFRAYKALSDFSVQLHHMNVLVGANNHGKSTVLGAFRILDVALRTMRSKKADVVAGPNGRRPGWRIPDDSLPVSMENVHTNYADEDSSIVFRLSNRTNITIFFPSDDGCFAFADTRDGNLRTPNEIRRHAPIRLTVVPILGPLEHREKPVQEETVLKNLASTRASRNFRNYWRHFGDGFDAFAALVARTWPGMTVSRPETSQDAVVMFCEEKRYARELFWAGFGFQIWLQLLTHISRSDDATLIVVDEPELYLHPDVQRQLLGILRESGADLMMATHSTEIMAEADPTEILLIDKTAKSAERLRDVDGIQRALSDIGSTQNITLTRLARSKKLLFVEGGADSRLIGRFARKLGYDEVAAWAEITALESRGFSSWPRVRALASAFEDALGFKLHVGAVFDRDYWCDEEIEAIQADLSNHLEFVHMHERKEIESYLLVPAVLDRAIDSAIDERSERVEGVPIRNLPTAKLLETISAAMKAEVHGQFIAKRVDYFRRTTGLDTATITMQGIEKFERLWSSIDTRIPILPGKQVLQLLRTKIAEAHGVNLTDHRIVNAFQVAEIPSDLVRLIERLDSFRRAIAH